MVLAGMVPRILAVLIVAAKCAATGRADAQSPPLEELLDRAMARRLSVSAVRPEYTVRFRWEPGSVAFWDNRATIHLAPSDHAELGFSRIMHRVMLAGDVPVGVDGKPSESIVGSEPGHW